jgi:DNA-binding transcriptional regulator YhcF (GntR family)
MTLDLNAIVLGALSSLFGGGLVSAAFWALAKDKLRETFVTREKYEADERLREAVIVRPLERVVDELRALNLSHAETTATLKQLVRNEDR